MLKSALVMSFMGLVFGAPASALAQTVFTDVTVGGHNICAIDTDNQLECTTAFERDVYLPIDDGTLYSDVSSGGAHSCAITLGGDIRCWGLNAFGQLDAPSSDAPFLKISAGNNHSCAVDANQKMHCWGLNTNAQLDIPEGENSGFVTPFAGANGSCGIRESGRAVCWSTDDRYDTDDLPTAFVDVIAGGDGNAQPSCGLRADNGTLVCWFVNPSPSLTTELPFSAPFVELEGNGAMVCGLAANGDVDCAPIVYDRPSLDDPIRAIINEIEALPPLTQIELSFASYRRSTLCGIDFDGAIQCASENLPAFTLPGETSQPVTPINLGVDVYSASDIELFWDVDQSALQGASIVGFNIYRDDQLLEFTTNGSSYLDNTLQAGVTYEYSLAAVDDAGNEGPRSVSLQVNTGDGETGGGGTLPLTPLAELQNIEVSRYSPNALELFWEAPVVEGNLSYRIYRNGVLLGSAAGPSFFDDAATAGNTLHYTILALRNGLEFAGVGFVDVGGE